MQPKATPERFKSAKGKFTNTNFDVNDYKTSNNSDYFIALSSSGGGYRAAYSTLGVMQALETLPSIKGNANFLQDIDLFSSVSGSGIATGYYISHVFNNKNFNLTEHVNQLIKQDQLTGKPNILRKNLDIYLFNQNVKQKYLIEQHFADIFKTDSGQLRLKNIFIDKASNETAKVPLWLINTTIFQNMAGLVLTPKKLINLGVSPKVAYDMHISKAAVASASYPMAIQPLKLVSNSCKHKCFLYLIDGGVNDNLGIMSTLSAIKNLKHKHKILIVIDASDVVDSPFSESKASPKPFDFMLKIPSMVTESHKQQIQQNMNLIAEDTRVIMLKISKDKRAIGIRTRFSSSLKEQKLLISIGKKLLLSYPNIQDLLSK